MRNRLLLLIASLLLLAAPARAQFLGPPQNITIIDSGTACVTAPAACASFSTSTQPSFSFDISGTWTGTITFEATANGSTWRSLWVTNAATGVQVSSTTAGGTFTAANGGYIGIRGRATGAITGTAVVTATTGYGVSAHLFDASIITGIVPATKGGTGFASYTVGDMLYADTTTSLAKLAAVAVGQVLASAGTSTAPAYTANPSVTTITAKGGSGTGTFKSSGVICDTNAATCSCTAYASSGVINTWNVITCTLPASTLAAVGDELTITADWLVSANANSKDIQLVWGAPSCGGTGGSMCAGGTLLASASTSTNGNSATAFGKIIKTGSSTQNTFGTLRASTAFLAQSAAAAAVTDTATILIAVGCRNTSAGAACADAPTPQLTIRYYPQ